MTTAVEPLPEAAAWLAEVFTSALVGAAGLALGGGTRGEVTLFSAMTSTPAEAAGCAGGGDEAAADPLSSEIEAAGSTVGVEGVAAVTDDADAEFAACVGVTLALGAGALEPVAGGVALAGALLTGAVEAAGGPGDAAAGAATP